MPQLDVTRQRMQNSRLIGPGSSVEEVVGWHGAMQAQDYGPTKWSIGQRARKLAEQDVDAALADGRIVRTHVLRPTWHVVAREDIRWLLALTGPRVHKSNGPRCRELGLDQRTLGRCERLIASALQGGNLLTRNEIAGELEAGRLDASGQRLPYILMHCELEAVICSGGLRGKQHTYALFDERVPPTKRFGRDSALVELTRRYLQSHGPATAQDLQWWSSMTLADIRNALEMLEPELETETDGALTLWSTAGRLNRRVRPRPACLLHPYDELIVGYNNSRFLGDPRAQAVRAAWSNRSLPNGIVLLVSGVFGHWRRSVDKKSIKIEVLSYDKLRSDDALALEKEVKDLGRFFGRDAYLEVIRIAT